MLSLCFQKERGKEAETEIEMEGIKGGRGEGGGERKREKTGIFHGFHSHLICGQTSLLEHKEAADGASRPWPAGPQATKHHS